MEKHHDNPLQFSSGRVFFLLSLPKDSYTIQVEVYMSANDYEHEREILTVMKRVLTDIAKETFTKPGLRHPLSDSTIDNMRKCLGLISAREVEIAAATGESMDKRPRYIDEPKSSQGSVVVKLDVGTGKTRIDDNNDKP